MSTVAIMSLFAGLADLVGGWFTLGFANSRGRMEQLLALGTGLLLGGALFVMLPAGLRASPYGPEFVAAGFLGLFAIRRLTARPRVGAKAGQVPAGPGVASAWAALGGMLLHSFFDGAALGLAAQADRRFGIMAFVAILLHKLPEGFSLAAVVLSATTSRRLAMLAAGVAGLATITGAILAAFWASAALLSHGALLGIAAGSFLYVGGSDMLPSVIKQGRHTWLVLVGAAMLYLLVGGGLHTHGY